MIIRGRLPRGLAAVALAVGSAATLAPSTAAAAPAQTAYTVIEVVPPAGYGVTATGINESGQVVGTVGSSAFVWSRATGLRVLGRIDNRGTFGSGINDRGEITGTVLGRHAYEPQLAFVWSPTSGFRKLAGSGSGNDINNAGQVAGGTGISVVKPARYSPAGQPQQLSDRVGAGSDINERGQVVGETPISDYNRRPFLWDPAAGLRDLGTFQPDNSGRGAAFGINDLGHAVGTTASGPSSTRAFLWRDGRLTAIGPNNSTAIAVNDRDHVVGQFPAGGSNRAFLYRDGEFRNLNDLIPRGGAVLESAVGINDSGWIVANSVSGPYAPRQAFLLIPA